MFHVFIQIIIVLHAAEMKITILCLERAFDHIFKFFLSNYLWTNLPDNICIFSMSYYPGDQEDGRRHKGTWQSYGINGLRKGFVFLHFIGIFIHLCWLLAKFVIC